MSTDDPTLDFITPRVAAGVLFTDGQDRILMVVPSYKDYLDIPGGYVENGETPYQAAEREVLEELGIRPTIGRLLVVDWREDSPEVDGGAKLLLVFDGGSLDPETVASITVDNVEITTFGFYEHDAIGELTIPRLAVRLGFALRAVESGSLYYLENGHVAPIPPRPTRLDNPPQFG